MSSTSFPDDDEPAVVVVAPVGIVGNSEPAESCPQVHRRRQSLECQGFLFQPLAKSEGLANEFQDVSPAG